MLYMDDKPSECCTLFRPEWHHATILSLIAIHSAPGTARSVKGCFKSGTPMAQQNLNLDRNSTLNPECCNINKSHTLNVHFPAPLNAPNYEDLHERHPSPCEVIGCLASGHFLSAPIGYLTDMPISALQSGSIPRVRLSRSPAAM